MLEKLMELIKEHGAEAIFNNEAIPAEHKHAAIKATAAGIAGAMLAHTNVHGVDGITDMITKGDISPELMDDIKKSVADKLVEKLALPV